jgi:dihydrolipoamide dehydrogenase
MLHWRFMAYDVVVIGSGPGGYSAAVRAGQYGLKTAIIEKDKMLGGTCLHVGCIPTKSLLHSAEVWDYFQNPEKEGITVDNARLDYPKVIERKTGIVNKHAKGVEYLMKKNKSSRDLPPSKLLDELRYPEPMATKPLRPKTSLLLRVQWQE